MEGCSAACVGSRGDGREMRCAQIFITVVRSQRFMLVLTRKYDVLFSQDLFVWEFSIFRADHRGYNERYP